MFQYIAEVQRVVDGDTLDLRIDLGFKVDVRIRVRLIGVDTPETFGVKHDSDEYRAGRAARAFVEAWLRGEDPNTMGPNEDGAEGRAPESLVIRSHDGKAFGVGKYGRWLVEVFRVYGGEVEAVSLNDALLEAGHAEAVTYG